MVVPQNSATTFQNTFIYNRNKDTIIGLESAPKHTFLDQLLIWLNFIIILQWYSIFFP